MIRSIVYRTGFLATGVAIAAILAPVHHLAPEGAHSAVAALLVIAMGVFVWRRASAQEVNQRFALLALSVAAYLLVVTLLILGAHIGVERVEPAVRVLRNGNLLMPFAFMSFLCAFLERRATGWRLLQWASLLTMAPFLLLNLFGLYITEYRLIGPNPKLVPYADATLYRWCGIISLGWALLTAALVLGCAFVDNDRRKRVQYLAFLVGWLFLLLPSLLGFLPAFDVSWYPSFLGVSAALFPIVLGLAIARLSLFDIRLVVRRTVPYAVAMGSLGALSGAVLIPLRHYAHLEPGSFLTQGLLLMALACLFQPVFEASKSWVDRVFFRTEAELEQAAARLAVVSYQEASPLRLAVDAAREVQQTLAVEWVAILLGRSAIEARGRAGPVPDALWQRQDLASVRDAVQEQPGATSHTAVRSSGEGGCMVVVGEKKSHEQMTRRETDFLAAVAAQTLGGYVRQISSTAAEEARWMVSALVEMLPLPACVVSREGRFLEQNAAFCALPGLRQVTLERLLPDSSRSPAAETQIDSRHFLIALRPMTLQQDEALLVLFQDVTELHHLREQAQRREALALLGTAVSSINHEIENILTPARIYLDRLGRDLDAPTRARYSRLASERFDLLTRLTSELRDVYRPPVLRKRPCDLRSVVEDALQDLAQSDGTVFAQPELKGLDLRVEADPMKLRQVLLNLMQNALHAMEGQPQPAWTIDAALASEEVTIRIRDNGRGICEADVDRLFEPFFSTKRDRGTGLGLAVVKRLVEAHDGRIRIDSETGHGTTITMNWPAADATPSPQPARDEASPDSGPSEPDLHPTPA